MNARWLAIVLVVCSCSPRSVPEVPVEPAAVDPVAGKEGAVWGTVDGVAAEGGASILVDGPLPADLRWCIQLRWNGWTVFALFPNRAAVGKTQLGDTVTIKGTVLTADHRDRMLFMVDCKLVKK